MGTGATSSTAIIPDELKDLYLRSANQMVNYQNNNPLAKFGKSNVLDVAGLDPLEAGAAKLAPQLWDKRQEHINADNTMNMLQRKQNQMFGGADEMFRTAEQMRTAGAPGAGKIDSNMNYAQQLAARKVKADAPSIANDAALQASQDAFKLTAAPMIGNQMASMGLGRSMDRGKITADAWAKNATPHVQAAIQREQDRMNKMTDTAMGVTGQRLDLSKLQQDQMFRGQDARAQALGLKGDINAQQLAIAKGQLGSADQRWNQMKGAIDTGMGVGGVRRGVEDAGYKAAYDDYLRRQGLAEKALYAPFGQSGNMIGQKTSQGK